MQAATFLLGVLAALVGAAGYFQKVRKDRADAVRSREISARAAWEKYLLLAFANPKLSRACYATDDEFEAYEWFVSLMLYAAEEVLCYVSLDEAWNKAIGDQIGFHKDYLKGPGRKYLGGYSVELQTIFVQKGVLRRPKPVAEAVAIQERPRLSRLISVITRRSRDSRRPEPPVRRGS